MAPHSKGEKDGYDVNYYYIEGHKLFKLHRYEEALAACEAAIHLKPDNVWSYYNQSLALHCLGCKYWDSMRNFFGNSLRESLPEKKSPKGR